MREPTAVAQQREREGRRVRRGSESARGTRPAVEPASGRAAGRCADRRGALASGSDVGRAASRCAERRSSLASESDVYVPSSQEVM